MNMLAATAAALRPQAGVVINANSVALSYFPDNSEARSSDAKKLFTALQATVVNIKSLIQSGEISRRKVQRKRRRSAVEDIHSPSSSSSSDEDEQNVESDKEGRKDAEVNGKDQEAKPEADGDSKQEDKEEEKEKGEVDDEHKPEEKNHDKEERAEEEVHHEQTEKKEGENAARKRAEKLLRRRRRKEEKREQARRVQAEKAEKAMDDDGIHLTEGSDDDMEVVDLGGLFAELGELDQIADKQKANEQTNQNLEDNWDEVFGLKLAMEAHLELSQHFEDEKVEELLKALKDKIRLCLLPAGPSEEAQDGSYTVCPMLEVLAMLVQNKDLESLVVLVAAGGGFYLDYRAGPKGAEIGVLDLLMYQYFHVEEEKIFYMILWCAPRMNPVVVLKTLFSSESALSIPRLAYLCERVAMGSTYPLITMLDIARLMVKAGDRPENITLHDEFHDRALSFSKAAVKMVEELRDGKLMYILLDAKDPRDISALDLALKSNNNTFISSSAVSKVINTLFVTPYFMYRDKLQPDEWETTVYNLMFRPNLFFRLPVTRFILSVFFDAGFLFMYTWLVAFRPESMQLFSYITKEPGSVLEMVFYSFAFGKVFSELREVYKSGIVDYFWQNYWNFLDFTQGVIYISMFSMRIAYQGQQEPYKLPSSYTNVNLTYVSLVGLTSVLQWVRLMYIFSVHQTLGPLIRMIANMLKQILTFMCLMLIFMLGFAMALYFMNQSDNAGRTQNVGFSSFAQSLFSLTQVFIGESDFAHFDNSEHDNLKYILLSTYTFYCLLCIIMLVNLLIALMTTTYEMVQNQSAGEFVFGRSRQYWENVMADNELPSPFSFIVFVLVKMYDILVLKPFHFCTQHACDRMEAESSAGFCCMVDRSVHPEVMDTSRIRQQRNELQRRGGAVSQQSTHKLACARAKQNRPSWQTVFCAMRNRNNAARGRKLAEMMKTRSVRTNLLQDELFIDHKNQGDVGWICNYCQGFNKPTTTQEMRNNLEECVFHTHRPKDLWSFIPARTRFCFTCFRVKRESDSLDPRYLRREYLSLVLYMIMLWPVLLIIVALPCSIFYRTKRLVKYCLSSKKNSWKRDEYDLDHGSASGAGWIRRNLVRDEPSPNELEEHLLDLRANSKALMSHVRKKAAQAKHRGFMDTEALGTCLPNCAVRTMSGDFVYSSGSDVVSLLAGKKAEDSTLYYKGHSSKVLCVAASPASPRTVASAQAAPTHALLPQELQGKNKQYGREPSSESVPIIVVHDTHGEDNWTIMSSAASVSSILSLDFSPDGKVLACVGCKNSKHPKFSRYTVGLWDWRRGTPRLLTRSALDLKDAKYQINVIKWINSTSLVTVGWGGHAYLWETSVCSDDSSKGRRNDLTSKKINCKSSKAGKRHFICACVSPKQAVVLGALDGSLSVIENGEVVQTAEIHKGKVNCVVATEEVVIAGGVDRTVSFSLSGSLQQTGSLLMNDPVVSLSVKGTELTVITNKRKVFFLDFSPYCKAPESSDSHHPLMFKDFSRVKPHEVLP
mmetsp:Transcript_25147/g.49492  ORF Transcript_25147/g.49492 Transcript_25147/m.49492 type:complete len:1512 (-) Transcript_25147:117-4652(-)